MQLIINLMSNISIPQMILNSAEQNPYRPAFWLRGKDRHDHLSYRLAARMLNLASGLVELGVKPGTRVGIYAPNSPEWCLAYLSILTAGGVVVPLDERLKYLELRSIISRAKVEHLFCAEHSRRELAELAAMISPHPQLVSLDADRDDLLTLARLERVGEGSEAIPHQPTTDEMAVLLFTSGTSGDSKGVVLSQRNILADLEAIAPRFPLTSEDRFLSVLPLHHTFEATTGFLYPLFCGASIVHAAALKSSAITTDIKDYRISIMCGVPLLYEKMFLRIRKRLAEAPAAKRAYVALSRALGRLYKPLGRRLLRPLLRKAGLDSLRVLASGGAALSPEINRFFNELGITLIQGYGLTETSPVVSVNSVTDNCYDSVGRPLRGVEVRIDAVNNEGIGEILVRGEIVMQGYFEDQEATGEALANGWFRTGDLGRLDRRNHLHITGRQKNVIVSPAGKNIYPEEIEAVLDNSPYILESAVLPRTRGTGEEPIAVVVPDQEIIMSELGSLADPATEELMRTEVGQLCQTLADYKRIKDVIVMTEELPKTSTRKVKKYLLVDLLQKEGVL
jgi:long-chain acyl-CoA synthetase